MRKWHVVGSLLVVTGPVLILSGVQNTLLILSLMVPGVLIVMVNALLEKEETSIRCRLGLHTYERVRWNEDGPGEIIECQRCKKRKEVMRGF
ncbi:hypothetical protein DXT76_15220 [Halobacillus trueperi]|uniref:Uncharacterized protein n=1 Tax=Halobacillus trueperi TaxID=156205 RepID=A0A3D8VLB2_9BACI|nr:hypothetical protein [Halobacillus trueperi]RDY70073.1 hypothetical protein DXT76_15220 [Halobacillus trueperi]